MTKIERARLRDANTSSTINTRQIQDYLTSGEADNVQVEGTAPSQEVVTFFDLDKAVVTDHSGLTNSGVKSHAQIDAHLDNSDNPHGVTWMDTGAAQVNHGHPWSEISGKPGTFPPATHNHDTEYYNQTLFADRSAGAVDGGRPVRLDQFGKISVTMVDVSTFQPQGNWDPSAGVQYPSNASAGQFWIVNEIVAPTGTNGSGIPYYTFTSGGLNTKNITAADVMVKTETGTGDNGWAIKPASDYGAQYYSLDGSVPITGPFAGGGQVFNNAGPGVVSTDLATLGQLTTGLAGKATSSHTHDASDINYGGGDIETALDNKIDSIVPVGVTAEVVDNFIVMTKAEYATITPQPGVVYGLKD